VIVFQDIVCHKATWGAADPNPNSYEYELIDTDFGSVMYLRPIMDKQNPLVVRAQIVIDEYSKRGLNVGLNLVLLLRNWQARYPISSGFECKFQSIKHMLTDELLRDIEKYMVLL
jgi:hypothetical protein